MNTRRFLQNALPLLFFLICVLDLPCAEPAETVLTPSLKLQETYDDNVFFKKVSDFEHLINPACEFYSLSEIGSVNTLLEWNIYKYNKYHDFDHLDQFYQMAYKRLLTPASEMDISGSYVMDNTIQSAFDELGIVIEQSDRVFFTFDTGVTFELNPKTNLDLIYNFRKDNYDSEDYPDHQYHNMDLNYDYQLTEQTTFGFLLSGNRTDYESSNALEKEEILKTLFGFDHQAFERLKFTFIAGAGHTRSHFNESQTADRSSVVSDTLFLFSASTSWSFEYIQIQGIIKRDVFPSLFGEGILRNFAGIFLNHQMTEKSSYLLDVKYHHSETRGLVSPKQKSKALSIHLSPMYHFNENMILQLGYIHNFTKNDMTSQSMGRNRVYLQLSMAWPKVL
ncbi:MAG: hypothetical protein HF978_00110 [Desulfobacteraceae bacterium]|nr:hypothetical protein [Desulfobacteraceae bacterium]MBC2753938.1 hypothetical protein [Desulfobacteraceae bacterium]